MNVNCDNNKLEQQLAGVDYTVCLTKQQMAARHFVEVMSLIRTIPKMSFQKVRALYRTRLAREMVELVAEPSCLPQPRGNQHKVNQEITKWLA